MEGNVFEEIGHAVKVGAEDVGKAVEAGVEYAVIHPIEFCVKAEAVIATAIKHQPAVKTAVVNLITAASKVAGDVATDVAEKGLNIQADLSTITDAESFFAYFKSTFVPEMVSVFKELKADVEGSTTDTTSTATAQ